MCSNCLAYLCYPVSLTHPVSCEGRDRLESLLFDVRLNLVQEDLLGAGDRLQEAVHVGQVGLELLDHHGLALGVQDGDVVTDHPRFALVGHLEKKEIIICSDSR